MVNNTNGKDEEIVNKGGEESVDVLESIKLIDMEEYNSLKKSEQEKYVVYNPGLTSQAYAMMLTQANNITDLLNQIGPMMSKLSPLTQGGMDLLNADAFINLINAVKVPADLAQQLGSLIGTISSTPVVSIVAKPLELICGTVGALAGLVYAMIMNPYNMLSAYYTAIKQLDLATLKDRFSNESIPNLELAKLEMDKVVIPDPDIKSYIDNGVNDNIQMVEQASSMLDTAVNLEATMESLQTADKQMRTYLKTINTMGMNWLLPQIQQLCDVLEMNYEAVADALCNNHFTSMEQMASGHVNGLMNSLPLKFIHVNDLEKLKNHQAIQQQKDDYNSGYDDGLDDGEDIYEEYLEQFEKVSDINEVEMWKYRDEKLEEKVKELEKDEENTYYISGYREGFKKGFEDSYEKSKKTDYDRGYDDGLDEGEEDCEKMVSKMGASVLNDSATIEEYMTKMIQNKKHDSKSQDYKDGYSIGYKESFNEALSESKEDERKDGLKDGKKVGREICNVVTNYLTNSQILSQSTITVSSLSTMVNLYAVWKTKTAYKTGNRISYNNVWYQCMADHTSGTWATDLSAGRWKVLFTWNIDTLIADEGAIYQSAYKEGIVLEYNNTLNSRKSKAQNETNESDEETGYKDGKNAGQTAGQNEANAYESILVSQGVTGTIDRYMAHDKHHDETFGTLIVTPPSGKSGYYNKGYEEGYYYGYTNGYYKTIEIFK